MPSYFVIIPPLLVLVLAMLTKKILPSLFLGIVSAAFIMKKFSPGDSINFLVSRFWEQIYNQTNFCILSFSVILGILTTLMSHTGGTVAYGRMIKRFLQSARSAQFSSIILSVLFMFDDFFSSTTVGCVMRPLTDSMHIAHAKLAFLIDSLAAPLAIMLPISTWIGTILMNIKVSGISLNPADEPIISMDPFSAYLNTIPFIFYSIFILASSWFIIHYKISFGPMKKQEEIAEKTGNLFGGKPPLQIKNQEECKDVGSIWNFILPLGSLIVFCVIVLLYSGKSVIFGGDNNLLQTMQQGNIFLSLFLGGLFTLIINFSQMLLRRVLTIASSRIIIKEGWNLMASTLLLLLLAWTFSTILKDDLQTGHYIASLLHNSLPLFLLPAMFFITTFVTSFVIGTSWGAFALLLPIAIPMLATFFNTPVPAAPFSIPLLYPVIGAIFAGGVAGDHLSPIAATTVLSATSADCYLHDHIYTQFAYAFPIVFATIIAYTLLGSLTSYGLWFANLISLLSGLVLSLSSLYLLNAWSQRSNKAS